MPQTMTFDNWVHRPGTKEACDAVRDWVGKWPEKPTRPLLLLAGPYGTGKTHLCHAVANEINSHYPYPWLKVWNYGEMAAEMLAALEDNRFGKWWVYTVGNRHQTFFIVDDWGVTVGGGSTGWVAGQFERIVNQHYEEATPLLVSTNRDIKELPPAILSRFRDKELSRIVIMDKARDYRPGKKGGLA